MRCLRHLWLASLTFGLIACARVDVPPATNFQFVTGGLAPARNFTDRCVDDYRPEVDYFAEKTAFEHSAQLQVSYHRSYKRVTFTPSVDTKEVVSMVLVQCGAPSPPLRRGDVVVRVPVARFATSNATMLGAVDDLGLVGRLRGVPNLRTVSVLSVRQAIEAGQVLEVGSSTHSNLELALALEPQLLFTFYSAYPQSNVHRQLQPLGVGAVPMADHTELTPLGRAEWLKYIALFFNAEARANAVFAPRAQRYAELAQRAQAAPTRPDVLAGYAQTRDDWLLPGGRNFLAQLIADAGGRFFNSEDLRSGTLNYVPMERAYAGADTSRLWIGYTLPAPASASTFARQNSKLGWFRPVRDDQVYWLDARREGRRNPFRDQSLARPDEILADTIAAIHPGLLEPTERSFLRKIGTAP